MFSKISAKLDEIANNLEAKGLVKEASRLDEIANTLEAKNLAKDAYDYMDEDLEDEMRHKRFLKMVEDVDERSEANKRRVLSIASAFLKEFKRDDKHPYSVIMSLHTFSKDIDKDTRHEFKHLFPKTEKKWLSLRHNDRATPTEKLIERNEVNTAVEEDLKVFDPGCRFIRTNSERDQDLAYLQERLKKEKEENKKPMKSHPEDFKKLFKDVDDGDFKF